MFAPKLARFQSTVQRSFPLQVLLAVVISSLAVLLRIIFHVWIGETILRYGIYYLAILFTAWAAGMYPAWFSLGLVSFGQIYIIRSGLREALLVEEYLIFLLTAGVLIALIENLRVAFHQSEERRQVLQETERRLQQALAEADQERRRLKTVLKALPVGVHIADKDGRMIERNEAGVKIWGGEASTERGISDYINYKGWWADTGERILADDWAVARALRRGEISINEVIDIERFDGTRGTVLNSAAPILDADGNIIGGVATIIDITQQREAERALRESEARYRALWDDSFDSKLLHENGIVLDINQGFSEMFGYTLDELNRKDGLTILATPDSLPIIQERIKHYDPSSYEALLRRKDGSVFWAEIESKQIMLGGRMVRLTAIRDITVEKEAKQRAIDLDMQKARLQTITSLIQNISHDFRTPLSTINTSVYLLERLNDPERRREKGEVITAQVKRLIKLVDSMMMMTRLNSEDTTERQPVELPLLLHSVEVNLKSLAAEKSVALYLDVDTSLPPLSANESQLESLFSELTSNAINYTPEGGSVYVRADMQGENVVVEVHDTGIGIDAADQGRIFEAFYRVDEARGIDTGGVGLGLAIAKKIVDLHMGKIEVESDGETGSSFRVTLPVLSPLPEAASIIRRDMR